MQRPIPSAPAGRRTPKPRGDTGVIEASTYEMIPPPNSNATPARPQLAVRTQSLPAGESVGQADVLAFRGRRSTGIRREYSRFGRRGRGNRP